MGHSILSSIKYAYIECSGKWHLASKAYAVNENQPLSSTPTNNGTYCCVDLSNCACSVSENNNLYVCAVNGMQFFDIGFVHANTGFPVLFPIKKINSLDLTMMRVIKK